MIVPDADWPRNGDIVVGSEIPDVPGESIRCLYSFGGIFNRVLINLLIPIFLE